MRAWDRRFLKPAAARGTISGVLLLLLLSGCKHHPKHEDAGKKGAKRDKDDVMTPIAVGPGSTVVAQSSDPAAPPSFDVNWTTAHFAPTDGQFNQGAMTEPKGQIFQTGKPSATYRADTGDSTRGNKRLNMRGHVVLQSIDRLQTMRSPFGQYRGDIPIVRATGGVTATGTFGTLSGVPELWATPDLRLIGTPDMIAKTLKIPALAALAATAALPAMGNPTLQKGTEYTVENKGGSLYDNRDLLHPKATFNPVKGKPLIVTLPARGLVFRFTKAAVLEFVPKTNQVRHMTSDGPVNVVQTTPNGTTTIDGTSTVYDTKPDAPTADLALGGPVTILDEAKGANGTTITKSRGDRGSAILRNKPTGDESGLQSATLVDNVVIDSKGGKPDDGTFHGTGDRGVYTPGTATNDVDMAGHVVLTRVSKAKDGTTNTVVSHGEKGHAILDAKPAAGISPMKTAVLTGGLVTIDVDGSNNQKFKGTGDKVVYTGHGAGGTAVMTGDLKFSGDLPGETVGDVGADIATVNIGKAGWETIETANSENKPTTTVINPKEQPKAPTTPAKKGKGKKGGKP